MRVIFETAGGQKLNATVTGEQLDKFVGNLAILCEHVRTRSVKNADIAAEVRRTLEQCELLAKEPTS